MTTRKRVNNPGGRPRKYANDAEKQAAFRQRWSIINVRTEKDTKDTIMRLAEFSDASEAEVVNSLIKFALLNRNWFTLGLFGKRLPTIQDKRYRAMLEAEANREGANDE